MQQPKYDYKSILDLFPANSLNGEFAELVGSMRIVRVSAYRKSGKLVIFLSNDRLIPAEYISELEKLFADNFKLNSVEIRVKYDVSLSPCEILTKYWDSLIYMVNRKVAMSRGILSGCTWDLKDGKLDVMLSTKGADILRAQGCDRLIEDLLAEFFPMKVRVGFQDAILDDDAMVTYIENRKKEEYRLVVNEIQNAVREKANGGNGRSKPKDAPLESDPERIILGKDFKDPATEICEVTPESGKTAVRGDIIRVEYRDIRGGKTLCSFDVTDYTSSITVKFFSEGEKLSRVKDRLTEDITVKVRGEAQYDKYSKELTLLASDIIRVEKAVREDNAAQKRVELHMHTQMSSMDGITPVKDLVGRAAKLGHRAVAITDHGVVQAFPDAYDAAKGKNIKIIYGVECYLLDDSVPAVYDADDKGLLDDVVAVDIETTGLDAEKDRIIEIGAVRLKGGEVIDVFKTFVDPGISVPPFITKLTGIKDEMLGGAPKISDALQKFLEFAGDAVLVAHNAPFDIGFLKHGAKATGSAIRNPVVDTLQLCRKIFPGLVKYRLNLVAQHLGIDMGRHHRASDDANTTAKIYCRCAEILKEKGVKTIKDIENNFEAGEDYTKCPSYHAIILAENYTGLRNLYKLVSFSHLDYFYKKPRLPRKLIQKYREGLLLGSACEAGELFRAIENRKNDEEIARIARFYDYLEIQPLGNNQFLINDGRVASQEELKNINRRIVKLGEELGKPVVATCDVHFMEPRDEVFRRILMAGQGYDDADNQAPLFFRTTDEMLEEFSYLGEQKAYEVVVTNTNAIADRVEEIIPIPEGTFPPSIDGAEDEIRRVAEENAKSTYGDPLPEIVAERLEKELNSIIKNGFSVMYIIAQRLVSKSVSDGYLVGSRGSVGSSFVANMTGITEVNSLPPHYICGECKYSEFITDGSIGCGFDLPDKACPKCGAPLKKDGLDIPFETFLGFDGDKEPDIDLNFSGEYQANAHKYTEELFGSGNVYRAGTISTLADKTAYGFVKKYLDERNRVVTNAEINRLVRGCTGVKRTTGQHPGGVMIVPRDRDIYEFCPIQHPADDSESGVITTHFDYHSISGRLLKLDILGHDDPTAIRMLSDLTGVDARTIPIGEKRTMEIFRSTEPLGIKPDDIGSEVGTLGVPEFGTKFVRQILVDTKPSTFYELVRIAGLAHGTDVWLNNAQDIIRSGVAKLSEVLCTRDDIMLYLIYAGLPPKTAFFIMERVRKGKGLKPEDEEIMKEHKVPGWYIESCKKIKYLFPKAHAAAYVMMSFRIAWFKVYYPEAYYATYFTVRADEFDAELMTYGRDRVINKIRELEKKGNNMSQKEKNVLTILEVANEMYARGINLLKVDLYESEATRFQLTPEGIRPSLNALQGLGITAAQNIVEARKNGEFLSIEDLMIRAKVSKSVVEILQQHGCLRGLPDSSQLSLF